VAILLLTGKKLFLEIITGGYVGYVGVQPYIANDGGSWRIPSPERGRFFPRTPPENIEQPYIPYMMI